MTPTCPTCGASSKLTDCRFYPQTNHEEDTYECKNGHVFVDKVGIKADNNGYVIRADM